MFSCKHPFSWLIRLLACVCFCWVRRRMRAERPAVEDKLQFDAQLLSNQSCKCTSRAHWISLPSTVCVCVCACVHAMVCGRGMHVEMPCAKSSLPSWAEPSGSEPRWAASVAVLWGCREGRREAVRTWRRRRRAGGCRRGQGRVARDFTYQISAAGRRAGRWSWAAGPGWSQQHAWNVGWDLMRNKRSLVRFITGDWKLFTGKGYVTRL